MTRLTTGQVARRFGCTPNHVRALIERGELAAIDLRLEGASRPRWSISLLSVEAFEKQRAIRATEKEAHRAI